MYRGLALSTLTVAASCDTAPGEIQEGIERAAERPAYVYNISQRALYALDLKGPDYMGYLQLENYPSAPDLAFSKAESILYVFASKETQVAETGTAIIEFDISRNEIAGEILLPAGYLWHGSLDVSRSGALYLLGSTHSTGSSTPPAQYVVEISTATGAINRKIRLRSRYGRHRASSIRISPDARWAAVVSSRVSQSGDTTNFHVDQTSLMLVDLKAGEQVREVVLGRWLRSPTFTANGESLFATSLTGSIYHADLNALEVDSVYALPQKSAGLRFSYLVPTPTGNRMLLYYGTAEDSTTFLVFSSDGSLIEKKVLNIGLGYGAFYNGMTLCFAQPADPPSSSDPFPSGPSRTVSTEIGQAVLQFIDIEQWRVVRTDTVALPKRALEASKLIIPRIQ